jgi:hypothetical protein
MTATPSHAPSEKGPSLGRRLTPAIVHSTLNTTGATANEPG